MDLYLLLFIYHYLEIVILNEAQDFSVQYLYEQQFINFLQLFYKFSFYKFLRRMWFLYEILCEFGAFLFYVIRKINVFIVLARLSDFACTFEQIS